MTFRLPFAEPTLEARFHREDTLASVRHLQAVAVVMTAIGAVCTALSLGSPAADAVDDPVLRVALGAWPGGPTERVTWLTDAIIGVVAPAVVPADRPVTDLGLAAELVATLGDLGITTLAGLCERSEADL